MKRYALAAVVRLQWWAAEAEWQLSRLASRLRGDL